MKVPPKRKGNQRMRSSHILPVTLNESPSEKEGKLEKTLTARFALGALNESPSEKEGKSQPRSLSFARQMTLNESPSEKEGKLRSVAKRAPI